MCCISSKEIVVMTEKMRRLQDIELSSDEISYVFQ
jgi:hypothetical protein